MTNNKFKNKTIDLGTTLYDMNKVLMKNEESMSQDEMQEIVKSYFFETLRHNNYIMLLCNEKHDYTVFTNAFNVGISDTILELAVKEFMTCINNRGTLISIEHTKDNEALEIWINYNNEKNDPCCYYLFPYDFGVIQL